VRGSEFSPDSKEYEGVNQSVQVLHSTERRKRRVSLSSKQLRGGCSREVVKGGIAVLKRPEKTKSRYQERDGTLLAVKTIT